MRTVHRLIEIRCCVDAPETACGAVSGGLTSMDSIMSPASVSCTSKRPPLEVLGILQEGGP